MIKQYILPTLIALSALSISLSAAYYSVYGLSKLFSGVGVAIIIMASALEGSKLVIASLLHKYWNTINKLLRLYLSFALVVLMLITSAGIYGMLSSGYQKTISKSNVIESEIAIINNKKESFLSDIERTQTQINANNIRIEQLSGLRSQQETRLDTLYQRGNYYSARKTENIIKEANNDIKNLGSQINNYNVKINNLNDSISSINQQVILIGSKNEASAELGPLKYISQLTNKSMDMVANWLILTLVLVFDPLAIALVITANIAFGKIEYKPKKKKMNKTWKLYGENLFSKLKSKLKDFKLPKFKKVKPVVEDVVKDSIIENTVEEVQEEPKKNPGADKYGVKVRHD